jgi:hypothetical protein
MADPEARVVITGHDATARAFSSADKNLKSFARGAMQARSALAGFGVVLSGRAIANWMARSIEATDAIGEQREAVQEAQKAFKAFKEATDQLGESLAVRATPGVLMFADALRSLRETFDPKPIEILNGKIEETELRIKSLQDSIARNEAVRRHDGFLGFLFGSDTMDADLARLRTALQQAQMDIAAFRAAAVPGPERGTLEEIVVGAKRGGLAANTMRAMPAFDPNAPTTEQLRAAQRITEQMKTDVEQQVEAWHEAEALFGKGLISGETLTRFRDSLLQPIEVTAERMKQVKTEIEATTVNWAGELGDGLRHAFSDWLIDGEMKFKDFLKRLAADFVTSQLFTGLGTLLAGKTGGAAKFFGNLFGGARAGGGPVSAGKGYLVGERGPELFIPGSSGQVQPMGGGMTINVDARGSNDPAAVQAAVERGVLSAVSIADARTDMKLRAMYRPSMA